MEIKYEILTIRLGNFLTICLTVSFKKYENNTYILKNEKMNYEYYTEEKNIEIAKTDFAEAVMLFLESAVKEGKIFKWLENWGFEQKLNIKDAFNSALKEIKLKNNKQKINFKEENNFIVNNESLFLKDSLNNLEINQINFNWV